MATGASEYNTSKNKFLSAVDKALDNIYKKISSLAIQEATFGDSTTTLTLKDNTVHVYNGTKGVSNLTITYPSGKFMSTVLFSTAPSGTIKISFKDGTKFVGSASYEFFPGEDWELNIHNGRVVGSQLFKG